MLLSVAVLSGTLFVNELCLISIINKLCSNVSCVMCVNLIYRLPKMEITYYLIIILIIIIRLGLFCFLYITNILVFINNRQGLLLSVER